MPGQNLDIDYPISTEPFSTAFPKIIAAIQTIETDLEAKVVPAEIDFNADVDFGGYDVTGAQSLQLEATPDTTGYPSGAALFFDGEWYLTTDDGVVQVTSGGALNAAGIGGIVGDYGGVNPAKVTYVDAGEVYQFTDDVGDWSNVEVDSLIVHGASAAYTISLSDVALTNETLTIASTFIPAASGRALLTCDDAGVIRSTEGGSVSISPTFAADVILSGTAEIQHGTWSRVFGARVADTRYSQIVSTPGGYVLGGASSAGVPHIWILDGFQVGDVITGFTFAHKGAGATDDIGTISVSQFDQAGVETDAGASPNHKDNIGTSWGTQAVTMTPVGIGAGETVIVRVVPTQVGMSFGNLTVTYTHS